MKKENARTRKRDKSKAARTRSEEKRAKRPKFEPPKVITYSGDDILEELGPAHACNPFSGAVVAC